MDMEPMKAAAAKAVPTSVKRLSGWWLAATLAIGAIAFVASQQIEVLIFKVGQVCIGVLLAYLADRTLFRHAPDVSSDMPDDVFGAGRLIARAIVAFAVIAGVTIGI